VIGKYVAGNGDVAKVEWAKKQIVHQKLT